MNVTADHATDIWVNTELLAATGVGNTTNVLGGVTIATSGYGIWTRSWTADILMNMAGTINSANTGILTGTTTGAITADGLGTGTINAGAYGVYAISAGGDISVVNFLGGIAGPATAVYVESIPGGNLTVTGNGDLTGGEGVIAWTSSTDGVNGDIVVSDNGVITGEIADGVRAWTTLGGDIIINNNTSVGAVGDAIEAWTGGDGSGNGDITITGNGNIISFAADGIRAYSNLGLGGDITVSGNGNISGLADGVEILAGATLAGAGGNIVVTDNGAINGTAGDGIRVWSNVGAGGDVTVTGNGPVTGGLSGIVALALGDGAITVQTDQDVTGLTQYGIFTDNGDGVTSIAIDGGTITGVRGIGMSTDNGQATLDIAAGAIVQGTEYGLLTATLAGGLATTNNAGVIRDTTDTGAAEGDAGGDAIWSWFGNNIINNEAGGEIVGRIHSEGSLTFTLNNLAGAIWTPGTGFFNEFYGADDTINNAGIINIRDGLTTFDGLETFNNLSGGIVNLQYSGGTNEILWVETFAPQDGGMLAFDVDFSLANDFGDSSSTGLGQADTIAVVGAATPSGVTSVDLALAGFSIPSLIGTSGSIVLVDTMAADLTDPGLGGLASVIASDNYTFVSDPTSGAVAFFLVEDAAGGLYMQWMPNITADSLGGYSGGSLSGSPARGQDIAFAGAGSAGVGPSAVSGGPSGGGVSGSVADDAAFAAAGQGSSQACNDANRRRFWSQVEGSGSSFLGGASSWSFGGAFGVETDLSERMGLACGQRVVGAFAFVNRTGAEWSTGGSQGMNYGLGTYARAMSDNGFYGSPLGAVAFSSTDLANGIFGSTATQNATMLMVNGAVGIVRPVSDASWIDLRAYAAYSATSGDAFTDSAGIAVDGSAANVLTVGALAGLHHRFDEKTTGFIRAGAKWATASRSMSAFGISVSGVSSGVFGSIETGFDAKINENTSFSGVAFGDFGSGSTSYGGRAKLSVKF
ncbi:MAG: autotransporter outer membrane beta-barrel domain-containing protein [Rhizobiaceae bacterium]